MTIRGLMTLALTLGLISTAQAMTVTSPAFTEGGTLPTNGAQPNCGGGQNVSPALAWSGAPDGVLSYAVVLYDPDAPGGPGFVHWVAYGIPAGVTSIPAGFGTQTGVQVQGTNGLQSSVFAGYCPPPGSGAHHYTFTVYATDLAPSALQPGLTRDALISALHGHVKSVMSIIGRYGR